MRYSKVISNIYPYHQPAHVNSSSLDISKLQSSYSAVSIKLVLETIYCYIGNVLLGNSLGPSLPCKSWHWQTRHTVYFHHQSLTWPAVCQWAIQAHIVVIVSDCGGLRNCDKFLSTIFWHFAKWTIICLVIKISAKYLIMKIIVNSPTGWW